jgi:outer membrane protein assembly factor BamE
MKKISKFNFSKKITILLSIFFIVSCASLSPYKVPILQGNIFDEDDIEKLAEGFVKRASSIYFWYCSY